MLMWCVDKAAGDSTFKRKRRKVMTKEEAINVLNELRKAYLALDPTKARQAFAALLDTGKVENSAAHQLGTDYENALAGLKRVFDAMERKRIQFPSN